MSLTVSVEVPPRDREVLASWARSPSIRAGLAQRAGTVLLAAGGVGRGGRGRAKAGQAAAPRRCGGGAADTGAAATATGGDALVVPAAGRRAGPVECEGRHGVAGGRRAHVGPRRV